MTADRPEERNFYTQNEVGRIGELRTRLALEGKQHWQATLDADNTIDPQKIVCKAQRWIPKAYEHKHNLDYLIEAGPCNKCQVPNCEYKQLNPYPDTGQASAAEHRHEVKTNPATHTYETTGTFKDDGKRFAPTGNLFLEIWQNVKFAQGQKHKRGKTYPGKEGWFSQEPLAEWYHFYQPVTPLDKSKRVNIIEPEVYEEEIKLTRTKGESKEAFNERVEAEYKRQLKLSRRERAKEARRFAKEMTINDRLIYCRPWPYIVSIRGDQLRKLVHLCKKDKNNNLIEQTANLNGKTSIGYLLPIEEIMNDPHLYDRDSTNPIAFTHLPAIVRGTKPATNDKITYYLPEKIYHRIFKRIPASRGRVKVTSNSKKIVKWLNNASLTAPNFTFTLENYRYDETQKPCNIRLVNSWSRLLRNGDILINVKEKGMYEGLSVPIKKDSMQFATVSSGEAIGAVGDAHIKIDRFETDIDPDKPWLPMPNYQWFGLVPIQKLLNEAKIWPEKP